MKIAQAVFFFSIMLLFYSKTDVYCQKPGILINADSLIDNFMKEGQIPALFVAVVKGDSVLFQTGRGMASIENQIPLTASTCMELGSISKIFTAEVIVDLQNEGRLKIHDPITKYLPNAPSNWNNITILHLLNHSSGILNYLLDPRFMAFEYFTNQKNDSSEKYFKHVTIDSMIKMFYNLPLEFSPGFTWSYSNTGYYLLGRIIEIVTGRPFKDVVKERLLDLFEMNETRYNEEAEAEYCLAQGYFMSDSKLKESQVLSSNYAFSAGAWATTGSDMIKFLKAVNNGKIAIR